MKKKEFEIVSPGLSSNELSALDMQGAKGGVTCHDYNLPCIDKKMCVVDPIVTLPCLNNKIVIN